MLTLTASADAGRGDMFFKHGLIVLGCYMAATILPAQAGETSGSLTMSLTIRPSCEVSSRVDDGRYQVQDRGCSGAAAFKVESGADSPRLLTTSRQSVFNSPQASSQKIVTIYW